MGSQKQPDDKKMRGLVLRPQFAQQFFEQDMRTRTSKTLELRSMNLRCVKEGERFFILACQQGRNRHGVNVIKVLGSVQFDGNEQLDIKKVNHRYSEHLCSERDFQQLSKKWNKPHCIGWKVSNPLSFTPPKWLRVTNQEL